MTRARASVIVDDAIVVLLLVAGLTAVVVTVAMALRTYAGDVEPIPDDEIPAAFTNTTAPSSTTSSATSTTAAASSSTTAVAATSTTSSAAENEHTWPWPDLADCESGDWRADGTVVAGSARWDARDGIHEGGLQFAPTTWDAYKLPGYPDSAADATPAHQVLVAVRVRDGVPGTSDPYLNAQGYRAWPTCGPKVGAR